MSIKPLRHFVQLAITSFEEVQNNLDSLLRNPEIDPFERHTLERTLEDLRMLYEGFTDRVIIEAQDLDPEGTAKRIQDLPEAEETMRTIRQRVINRIRSRSDSIDPGVILATLGEDDSVH